MPCRSSTSCRAEAGERIDRLLDAIAELQRMIDTSPAETLEDAAVRLLAGALSAVERAAAE